MKTIDVGAFEAKTHLSQLLDEIEEGAIVRISRRGRPVAVLKADERVSADRARTALGRIRELCTDRVTVDVLQEYRDEGREL